MKPTLKNFCEFAGLDDKLIRVTVNQFGGWDYFKESARDVARYGASGGFSGFTYYSDTCAFYAKHQKLINSYAEEMASDFGEEPVEMVRGFNCLGRADYSSSEVALTLYGTKRQHQTQVANALAWFALEEVARRFDDWCYEERFEF